jgi:hypothetical protein
VGTFVLSTEMLSEIHKREKEAGIEIDPELDFFMKVSKFLLPQFGILFLFFCNVEFFLSKAFNVN